MSNLGGPVPRLLRLLLPARRGGMSRLFHAVYARIRASWQMLPLGFLFDLGFDTATEVAMLGLSAAFAQHSHFPVWGILVFPLLFAAGMSLMDTLDGLAMLKVYDWAMQDATRKLGCWRRCQFKPHADRQLSRGKRDARSVKFEFRHVPTGSRQTRRMAQIDLDAYT